jgi:choline dehydrogenase-like flavoprotein
LHANVTKLETDDRGEVVTCARASTLAGHRIEVRAKAFVLASGGLEVPRLMLLSRTRDGIGIGNRYDLVGRFFMEHPHVNIGRVVLTGDRGWVRAYQLQRLGQRVVRLHLCLPECLQRKAALLNCSCSIDIPDEDETSYAALRRIKRTIVDPFENGSILRDLARTVANPLDVAFGVYSKLSRSRYIPRKRIPDEILLRIRAEQAPIPHSRVTLSDRRDALGLQQIKLDWQLSGEERRSMRIMARVLSEEFTRLGLGEVHLFSWLAPDQNSWPADLVGGPHHMGTTRMCDDPRQGVVDRDCRVHGVKNLFIAGSAVFPTGGYVNPTLTIVALAVRLADHLERVLPLPSLHVGPVGMARGKGRQMGDETTTP